SPRRRATAWRSGPPARPNAASPATAGRTYADAARAIVPVGNTVPASGAAPHPVTVPEALPPVAAAGDADGEAEGVAPASGVGDVAAVDAPADGVGSPD